MSTPYVVAGLHMHTSEVIARSSVPLRAPIDAAHGSMQPWGPHRVELQVDDNRSVPFAPSLFSLIETHQGRVARIHTTPQLGYATLAEAAAIADGAASDLVKAGFERGEAPVPVDTQLLVRDRALSFSLRRDALVVELWLRRVIRGGSASARLLQLGQDAYLVTVVVRERSS